MITKVLSLYPARFMGGSLSNLVNDLAKCKDCDCFLEYVSFKGNLIKYTFLSCNKDYSNKLDEKL